MARKQPDYSIRIGSERLANGYTRLYDAPRIVETYTQWFAMLKDAHNQSVLYDYVDVQLWTEDRCVGRYTATR